jgi:hypothetical protein
MKLKGFKAFNKGLVCQGKQYAENTVFEEKEAIICKNGMHFCKNPLDTLDYYPLIDDNGDLSEFAEVEALTDTVTDDDKKFATKKLHIGARLDLKGFVKASIDFLFETNEANKLNGSQLAASGVNSQLAASGDYSQLAASGVNSQLAASGDYSQLAASGYYSKLAASGVNSQLAASGNNSKLAASGDYSQLAASGDNSQLAASGYYSLLAASGDNSKLAASGYYSKIALNGNDSVGAAIGYNNTIKGKRGCWITLAEYDYKGKIVCVKSAIIDGENIKADTWYKLKNGEFTVANEEESR